MLKPAWIGNLDGCLCGSSDMSIKDSEPQREADMSTMWVSQIRNGILKIGDRIMFLQSEK